MARSENTDPYQNYRFHLTDSDGINLDPVAAFTKVSIPDVQIQTAEYREGTVTYTKKFPGIPKIGDCEMFKGVAKKDSDFWKWIQKPIIGGQKYRTDLLIHEYHIDDEFGISGSPSRTILLKECFPIEFKAATDLDASNNDVSLTSLKVAVEEFDLSIVTK